jgi:hypothetical protein
MGKTSGPGKFRVLEGKHTEDGVIYEKGGIVDSRLDLAKRHNHPNSRKFERVPPDTAVQAAPGRPITEPKPLPQVAKDVLRQQTETAPEPSQGDAFDGLNLSELQDLARNAGISPRGKKVDLLERLRGHVAGEEAGEVEESEE